MNYNYDVIVVGGGHAGMEAAMAAAHMGMKTCLITLNFNKMSNMPCNPSIGGSAKGIVVREIDALGGMMGKGADKGALQIKMLNTGKGPGVQCLRAQEDKLDYPKIMQDYAFHTENLTLLEGMVNDILHDENKVYGVKVNNKDLTSKAVILTTGTYMEARVLVGHQAFDKGPDGEKSTHGLSPKLQEMGIKILRLKTGTPQRIKSSSIDYDKLIPQYGMEGNLCFSYDNEESLPLNKQIKCYLTYTNAKTHQIIKDNLLASAMYGGIVTGVGPRYCPSIEDKIVRFADKERHQLFLEPESIHTDSVYLQGFSTSMPENIQLQMVHSLNGLEHAEILKYAYAIEYDAIYPTQFDATLMVKRWPGLYCGGQICGTSGYEEAAGLGLMAGINASLRIKNEEPLILRRDESYIGVMIDDLINKGTKEPYRLLSSRAEFRLLIRHDNADIRLMKYGHRVGLINEEKYQKFLKKCDLIKENKEILEKTILSGNKKMVEEMTSLGIENFKGGITVSNLLKRPNITFDMIKKYAPIKEGLDKTGEEQLEILVKYEGYIEKEKKEASRLLKLDDMKIPPHIDYHSVGGLALEARSKLSEVEPLTIGQASRISGVNPADIAQLIIYIKKVNSHE